MLCLGSEGKAGTGGRDRSWCDKGADVVGLMLAGVLDKSSNAGNGHFADDLSANHSTWGCLGPGTVAAVEFAGQSTLDIAAAAVAAAVC